MLPVLVGISLQINQVSLTDKLPGNDIVDKNRIQGFKDSSEMMLKNRIRDFLNLSGTKTFSKNGDFNLISQLRGAGLYIPNTRTLESSNP